MAEVSHKEACPKCRAQDEDSSGDNLVVYADGGGAHCFACGYTIPSAEYKDKFVGYEYEESDGMGAYFDLDVWQAIKQSTQFESSDYRGITKEIAKKAGVRFEIKDSEVYKTYYPTTKGYELCGAKVREHPKGFNNPYGEVGKDCDLFMQHLFKTHNNIVLITGGEHDALAAYQMLLPLKKAQYDEIAVVSSTVGETSCFKQAQKHYEWFNQFRKIVIAMDSDEAGRKATESLVEVLPKGKVYVMNMRRKDPNAYLYNKETGENVDFSKEFISDFWAMKQYSPEGVKSASESFDEIVDELKRERITLPDYMHEMQEMMGGGMIQGRIANVIAYTSTGKSAHVNRMVYHWLFNSPVIPTVVSLEATAGQYMLELLAIHIQKNVRWHMQDHELIDFIKSEEGQRLKQELCFKEDGSPRFYIIDDRTGDIKDLENQLEKLFRKHDSRLFVIDVLSDLLRGSSEEHAEDHMHFQRTLNKEGVSFVNVLHTRKPANKSDGSTTKVTEYDALGTGSFVQSAAYNIVLNRDKLAQDPVIKNTTEVDLPKCRGGKTGSAGKWFYEFMTATCYDLNDWYSKQHDVNTIDTTDTIDVTDTSVTDVEIVGESVEVEPVVTAIDNTDDAGDAGDVDSFFDAVMTDKDDNNSDNVPFDVEEIGDID